MPKTHMFALIAAFAAYGFFAAGNAAVKALGDEVSLPIVLLFRFWLGLLFLAPLALRHFGSVRAWFHTTSLRAHLIRATLGMIAVICSFYAFTRLPFGDANALFRMTAIFMCALSGLILKERTTIRQWAAVTLSFGGVLLIAQPGHIGSLDLTPVLVMLLAALAAAISDLGMRDLAQKHHAMTITGWYFWLAAMAATPFALYNWTTPTLPQCGLLALVAASGVIGQLLLATALKTLTAPMIAPFNHTTFIWGFGLGFVIWHEIPVWFSLGGAVLILIGCIYASRNR